MSFVIWTFQRTGGTSLTSALGIASPASEVLHEPFNRERPFENITSLVAKGDLLSAKQALRKNLDQGVCIKHCFELHSNTLNQMLINELRKRPNYKHLLLLRKDEASRICSLFLAKQTMVWGRWKEHKGGYDEFRAGREQLQPFPVNEMLAHRRRCDRKLAWLKTAVADADISLLEKSHEQLYEGRRKERLHHLSETFTHLGVDFYPQDKQLASKLFANKLGSDDVLNMVPNLDEARRALCHSRGGTKS
jgi:hypothetical protein